jgi:hypothetical protein
MTEAKPSSEMMLAYTMTMIETDNHETALAASGYKSNPNAPTKWEKEGKPYYDAIKAAGDKIVLDYEQYQNVQATVNQLKTNEYTRQYFAKKLPEGIEIKYQFEYYWDFSYTDGEGEIITVKAKMRTDILVINHNTKTIAGLDLKTTGKPTPSFKSSYRGYKYYLQEGLFQEGIFDYKEKNYPDYTVLPFEFIVAQIGAYSLPMIYQISLTEHGYNIYGGKTPTGFQIKGVANLLEDLKYYERENAWEYMKEVRENKGRTEIKLFN